MLIKVDDTNKLNILLFSRETNFPLYLLVFLLLIVCSPQKALSFLENKQPQTYYLKKHFHTLNNSCYILDILAKASLSTNPMSFFKV